MNPLVLIVFLAPVGALLVVWAVMYARIRNQRRANAAARARYDALVEEVKASMPSRPPQPAFPWQVRDPRCALSQTDRVPTPAGLDTPTHLRRERRRREEERETTAGFLYGKDAGPLIVDDPLGPLPAYVAPDPTPAWSGDGGSFSGGGASGGWDSSPSSDPSPSSDSGSSSGGIDP